MSICQPTIRPYTKAIFSLALAQEQLMPWHAILETLAKVVVECNKNKLLTNPRITNAEKISVFITVVNEMPAVISNLVKLLIERKKIFLLPDIAKDYRKLLLIHNDVLEVTITSSHDLTLGQKAQLLSALKKRYQREISLTYLLDPALIGGARLQIEDRVIDGSIMGMLQRLKKSLILPK